jgi:hypothetical protein
MTIRRKVIPSWRFPVAFTATHVVHSARAGLTTGLAARDETQYRA